MAMNIHPKFAVACMIAIFATTINGKGIAQDNHVPVKRPQLNITPSALNQPRSNFGIEEIPVPGISQQDGTIDDQSSAGQSGNGNLEDLPPAIETSLRIEVIQQKYPNGQVQLQRQVMLDEDDNYQNHGFWQLFNEQNQSIAEGHFQSGNMHGPWKRWHAADSGGIFRDEPFRNFAGPFLSMATFENGKLHGTWSIYDSQQRKMFEMPYDSGRRHGRASWWHPNGSMARQVTFYRGQLEGELIEWNEEREVTRRERYEDGRRIYQQTSFHQRDQMESQAQFYDAKREIIEADNWWDAEPAPFQMVDSEFQHGPTQSWFRNGQLRSQGQYQKGKRHGQFTWWHSNGQKQLVGYFENGLRVGKWTQWHVNGMKEQQCSFENDQPVGEWIWWDEQGNVTRREDMTIPNDSNGDFDESNMDMEEIRGFNQIDETESQNDATQTDDSKNNGPPLVPPNSRLPAPGDT
jgi:antitoxin component YwqK of YwqJK toxin-antitoxin module